MVTTFGFRESGARKLGRITQKMVSKYRTHCSNKLSRYRLNNDLRHLLTLGQHSLLQEHRSSIPQIPARCSFLGNARRGIVTFDVTNEMRGNFCGYHRRNLQRHITPLVP